MDIAAFASSAARQSLDVLLESAPFALAGFFAAGLFRAFAPERLLKAHLAGPGVWPVLKASLVGVPVPLCSCGVVPAAVALRQAGASKGAATAFLIATPETGPDSVAVNYALLDPLMTVIRPVAAIFMATLTGVLVNRFDPGGAAIAQPAEAAPKPGPGGCSCSGGGCKAAAKPAGFWPRFKNGMDYAFGDMLADVGVWLLFGVALAGMIAALVPEDGLSRYLGSGFPSMAAMLVLSAPVYVCATASTPIVAALAAKGLAPGAALVFLLAGPASNIASLTVFARMYGGRATAIYVACVAACSLACGAAVNALYDALRLDISHWIAPAMTLDEPGPVSYASAALLVALIVRAKLAGNG